MNSLDLIKYYADLHIVLGVKAIKHTELIQAFRKKEGDVYTGSDQNLSQIYVFS